MPVEILRTCHFLIDRQRKTVYPEYRIYVRNKCSINAKGKSMFRKQDFILIMVIVVITVFSALLISLAQKDTGEMVRITIDGTFYGEYSLSENKKIVVDEILGYNMLVIENGSVYMADADCPDKYCMDYKAISNGGETIICLPHRLVAEVTGERSAQQPDVIVP